jgi:hypothetical protein
MNRRFSQGVQFGLAYTWSKALGVSGNDTAGMPRYQSRRVWMYGPLEFDQPQCLVINYVWELPKLSSKWQNGLVKQVFDGWQLSGITSFAVGRPMGIGFSTTDNADITGGGDGARVVVVGPAKLPQGERTPTRWFNTEAFARPAQGTFGNAPRAVFNGPGINNWDMSVFKNFPVWGEERFLQLRWDIYNVWNHTQFASVDATASFNPAGQQVNQRFGQVTSARLPRIMQLGLRFQF